MPETRSSWFDRNLHWIGPVLLVAGIAAVGGLSGYYIGQTQYDVTIVAAVITAVTAGAGATLGLFHFGLSDFKSHAIIGTLLLVYAATTLGGTAYGIKATRNEELRQLFSGIELRAKYLLACADVEAQYNVNGYRKILELLPLPDTNLCK